VWALWILANTICNKALYTIKYSTVTKYISRTNYNITHNYTISNIFAFTLPVLETMKTTAHKKFITELIYFIL
jgi:hypothetical protein